MTTKKISPIVTTEMFASKINEMQTVVNGLDADDLKRAYDAVSVIAKSPHLYDVHDGLRLPENPNLIIQTRIAGPVTSPIPILIPRASGTGSGTAIVVGPLVPPLPTTGTGVKATCPHCKKQITVILK